MCDTHNESLLFQEIKEEETPKLKLEKKKEIASNIRELHSKKKKVKYSRTEKQVNKNFSFLTRNGAVQLSI